MYVAPESRAPSGSTAKPEAKKDAGASAFLSWAPVSRPASGSLAAFVGAAEGRPEVSEVPAEQAARASGSTAAASSVLAGRYGDG